MYIAFLAPSPPGKPWSPPLLCYSGSLLLCYSMRYSVINLFVSDLLNANFSFSEYHGYHQQHTDSLPARQHGFYISLCSTAVLIPPLSLSLGPLVISLFVSLSSFSRFFMFSLLVREQSTHKSIHDKTTLMRYIFLSVNDLFSLLEKQNEMIISFER